MSADTKDQMLMMAAQTVDEQATALLKAFTATFAGDFTTIFKMAEVTRSCKAPIQHPNSFHLVLLPFYFFHISFFPSAISTAPKKIPTPIQMQRASQTSSMSARRVSKCCAHAIDVDPQYPTCASSCAFIVGGARGKKRIDVAN